jgi:hypothetical protein
MLDLRRTFPRDCLTLSCNCYSGSTYEPGVSLNVLQSKKEVKVMKLRNLGVYALPDGSEFVVEMLRGGKYDLCLKKAWDYNHTAKYQIDKDGNLVSKGNLTDWRIEHLIDTGHRVKYPKPSLML